MSDQMCRACGGHSGEPVLDLGRQPASDYFPSLQTPGPDPVHPLRMWLCSACGLAQLAEDATVPDEPRAVEPAALVAQAADAVERVAAAGWLPATGRVAEYGSPHGGSWLGLVQARGLRAVAPDEEADVVLDCFGLMHSADQRAAVAERAARVAPGGVLLLQYHSLATIMRRGQWNSLRHGHFAYYSATALSNLLAAADFGLRSAWSFDLYGGTVLVAATRTADGAGADASVLEILAAEDRLGVTDPDQVRDLQRIATASADALHDWLVEERDAGRSVLAYGAASRAVSLLCRAGIGSDLLPAIADASVSKQGSRMPGTDIPIIDPGELVARRPDAALLMLPDLLAEVRAALPGVEAAGARWVDVDEVCARPVMDGAGRVAASRTKETTC